MVAVFVDVDGTLIRGSSEKSFLFHFVSRGELGAVRLAGFIAGYAAHPVATLVHGPGWNRGYLRGMDERTIRRLADDFSRSALIPRIRPGIMSELTALREGGARLILLSASLEWLVGPLGESVQASCIFGSKPGSEGGMLTGSLDGPRPFGEEKLRIVEAYCRENGVPPRDCVAYGDSWGDRHVMGFCGRAVAVRPGRRLARLARERGWRILETSE
ncbi:MAG TPA: HAD-IB family phosphatase [Candidatus Fermentibacter daniensis]|nr:HAD-IB family phosphatase [Candidatus Fermentibacter daniensis]HOR07127.1 HAD-IB family phosphatase [Candidatus Fermentibacter daniensis]HPK52335.1 HAD-IB family phosphatase [Candidatus Fermentibacter daniensis]HQE57442.1 HAD-IB family phosphatase [Candidatus Fermentibacter daniensis]